jgi:hypothetical protein
MYHAAVSIKEADTSGKIAVVRLLRKGTSYSRGERILVNEWIWIGPSHSQKWVTYRIEMSRKEK